MLMGFIKEPGPKPVAAVGGTQAPQNQQSGLSFWIYLIFALLIGLALFLWNLMTDLAYQMKIKAGDTTAKKQSVWQLMTSKSVISFVILLLFYLAGILL